MGGVYAYLQQALKRFGPCDHFDLIPDRRPVYYPDRCSVLLQSNTVHEHGLGGWQHAVKQAVYASECRPVFSKRVGGFFRGCIAEVGQQFDKVQHRETKTKPALGFQAAERGFAGIAQPENDIGIEEVSRGDMRCSNLI